jgi:hypothetical protein
MQPEPTPRRPLLSRLIRIVAIALSFIVILALMISVMIALGDPDGLIAPIMVFSPVVLVLVAVLIMQRSRRRK